MKAARSPASALPGLLARLGVVALGMGALLFATAGTLAWARGWLCVGLLFSSLFLSGLGLARRDPMLLAERLGPPIRRGQEKWDKVIIIAGLLLWMIWLAAMALDAARYRLSRMPLWLGGCGALAVLGAMGLVDLALRANPFAVSVVRIQIERGHRVITGGPYRFVRHPVYAGITGLILAIPLVLGSWVGLAMSPVLIVGLGLRAVLEERTLAAGLEGYADYLRQVRYRLIPYLW